MRTIAQYTPDNLRLPEHIFRTANRTLAAGTGMLRRGTVLGAVTRAVAGTTPGGSNAGDGTLDNAAQGVATKPGIYEVIAISDSVFEVHDPDGYRLRDAIVGTPYATATIGFTLTAGTTPFAAGDTFEIEIGAGSGELRLLTATATDGSNEPYAVLVRDTELDTDPVEAPCDLEGGFNENALHFADGENIEMYRSRMWARQLYTQASVPI